MITDVLPRIVLGSRSPQRLELLEMLIDPARIEVLPPRSADEPGFGGLEDWPAIRRQLKEIAVAKAADVRLQLGAQRRAEGMLAVLCADTVIIVNEDDDRLRALGQPPEKHWQATVYEWFRRYFLGQTHVAATAVCMVTGPGQQLCRLVESQVTFYAGMETELERYLKTGEPRGKAGGYALQGEGAMFIKGVQGSVSNVVGLPLRMVLEMFQELRINVG